MVLTRCPVGRGWNYLEGLLQKLARSRYQHLCSELLSSTWPPAGSLPLTSGAAAKEVPYALFFWSTGASGDLSPQVCLTWAQWVAQGPRGTWILTHGSESGDGRAPYPHIFLGLELQGGSRQAPLRCAAPSGHGPTPGPGPRVKRRFSSCMCSWGSLSTLPKCVSSFSPRTTPGQYRL